MPLWDEMDKAAREAAYQQDILRDGLSFRQFGEKYGATRDRMAGWIFRRNNPGRAREYKQDNKEADTKRGRWTEGRLTRKWQPKEKSAAGPKALTDVKKIDIIWPEPMRQRFIRMFNLGTQYKIIAAELGVSVQACKNMRAAMGLVPRRGRQARAKVFPKGRIHLNLTEEEYWWIRGRATKNGATMNDYIRNYIHKEMEDEHDQVQLQELQG
jgi:hypothetical protein